MKNGNGRRFLRIAIVGSLFVHGVFALIVRTHPVQAAPEQTPHHIIIETRLPPTPTPQPPKPHAQPKPAQAAIHPLRPAAKPPSIPKVNSGPGEVVASAPGGTPGPGDDATAGPAATAVPVTPAAPTPTPKPACSSPDVPARAVQTVTPERPADASAGAVKTQVRVELDAAGAVTAASVYQTSGDQVLDMAALRAAKASRYAPEERNCKNVPGSYLFDVDFQE